MLSKASHLAGSCKNGNEFSDLLSDYQLLKKDFASR
jgi:hypothetical protein